MRALESPAVERAIVRVLESEAAQESLERTLSSPRGRARRGEGARLRARRPRLGPAARLRRGPEAGRADRRGARGPRGDRLAGRRPDRATSGARSAGSPTRLDDGLERVVRRMHRPAAARTPRPGRPRHPRARRRCIDGVILNVIFLGSRRCSASSSALFGDPTASRPRAVVFGAAAWVDLRLGSTCSPSGRSPGRRPACASSRSGSRTTTARRGSGSHGARRRLVGLVLALIPFGLGLLGVAHPRRPPRLPGPPRRTPT